MVFWDRHLVVGQTGKGEDVNMSVRCEIVTHFETVALRVRELEEEARRALYDDKNDEYYRCLMREKALLLHHLPEKIDNLLVHLHDSGLVKRIKRQIGAFSFSAGKALDLDSVFYMSALLYPEDYADGECNDLESFIRQMKDLP